MKTLKWLGVLFTLVILGSGCGSVNKALLTETGQRLTIQTNEVITLQTNTISIPTPKVVDGILITNFVLVPQPYFITNAVVSIITNTVYSANPVVTSLLTAGTTISPLLGPIGPAIAAGLAGLSGLLGWFVRKKNGEVQSLDKQLTATIHGIETITKTLPEGQATPIKQAVAAAAIAFGVSDELHTKVQATTLA